MHLAITEEAAYFAFGEHNLEALKKKRWRPSPRRARNCDLEMSLKRFARALTEENKNAPKFAEEAFGQGEDNDTIRLTVEGGKSLRVRFTMKTPVVKFLALMGKKDKAADNEK